MQQVNYLILLISCKYFIHDAYIDYNINKMFQRWKCNIKLVNVSVKPVWSPSSGDMMQIKWSGVFLQTDMHSQ